MKPLVWTFLFIALLGAASGMQKFTGVITDDMCATGDHRQMRMGPTDADCTIACVKVHEAAFVLYDGKKTYILSDQQMPEKFAGKMVTVTGTLDPKAMIIRVDSIAEAK